MNLHHRFSPLVILLRAFGSTYKELMIGLFGMDTPRLIWWTFAFWIRGHKGDRDVIVILFNRKFFIKSALRNVSQYRNDPCRGVDKQSNV